MIQTIEVDIVKIRKAVAVCKKTQVRIAEECGLSPAHLWLLINGQRRLTATNFARICVALNLPMESFLVDK